MSETYSCLVVEDEPLAQKVLENYIHEHPMLELGAVVKDAQSAQRYLLENNASILFLDINLPGLSGIKLLKSLSHPPLVIFTTAYPEYAAEGFDLDAIDYLLKPFSFERFLRAVNKALEKLTRTGNTENSKLPAQGFIFLKADKKIYRVDLKDIQYLEGLDDYVKVVMPFSELLVNSTLKSLLEELPASDFIRVHKSFIIAKNKIVFLEGNYIRIGKKDIPIGATYREEIMGRLKDR